MTAASLAPQDIEAFEPEAKIALLATLDGQGLPHISLITSIQAKSAHQLMWGQFCEGRSKAHVQENPRTGFVIMNADRQLWRGKAKWTAAATEGDDFIHYNQLPMFRYNSYFGIHKVHYMDLVELTERGRVSLPRVVTGMLLARLAARQLGEDTTEPVLKPWARAHLSKPTTLKYLAYRGWDEYPSIIPVVPCVAADSRRLVIVPTVYSQELRAIATGTPVAIFGLNLEMESVLVRGRFDAVRWRRGIPTTTLDIDWVYNSMPPMQGQIHPVVPLRAVTEF